MGGLTWSALEGLLASNRTLEVKRLCLGASDAERRACSKPVMALVRMHPWDYSGEHDAVLLAALACGPPASLRNRVAQFSGLNTTAAYEVLADRDPVWLADLADGILSAKDSWYGWHLVRRLVRDGRIERPEHPAYLGRMASQIPSRTDVVVGQPQRGVGWERAAVYDQLVADPDLLEDEVYRAVTSEDGARSLAGWSKDRDETEGWSAAFVRLAAEGRVDRPRLLAAALDAFLSDIAPTTLGWHARLWKSLAPSLDEQAALLPRLARVVGTEASVGASLALDGLARLQKAKRLPGESLKQALPAALARSEKGTVVAALRLLDRSDLPADDAVRLAAVALASARTDVQEVAVGLIEKRAAMVDAGVFAGIETELAAVAPALVPRVSAWLSASTSPSVAASGPAGQPRPPHAAPVVTGGGERRPIVPPPLERWAAVSLGALAPPGVASMDELVDLLVVLLEESDDPLEFERAVEGIVRMRDKDPPASLVARARSRMEGSPAFVGYDPRADLAAVLASWGERQRWDPPDRSFGHPGAARKVTADAAFWGRSWDTGLVKPTLSAFAAGRAWEASWIVARRATTRHLSLPTRVGGWIDAGTLVQRVAAMERDGSSFAHFDAAQALLRLAPSPGGGAAQASRSLRSDVGRALRTALGDGSARSKDPVLHRCATWVAGEGGAVERSLRLVVGKPTVNSPWERAGKFDAVLVATFDSPARSTSPADPVSLLTNLADPLDHFRYREEEGEYASRHRDILRLWLPTCPATPETVLAGALPLTNGSLIRQRPVVMGFLAGLLLRGVPLGPVAYAVVVLALAAAGHDVRLLAADVLRQAVDDGRFDPVVAGEVLGRAIGAGVLKVNRVAASLADASRSSSLAAYRVGDMVEQSLPEAVANGGRDLHHLAAVLADSLTLFGRPVSVPGARAALEAAAGKKGTSRFTTDARRLLALQDGPVTPALREAIAQAEASRAARPAEATAVSPSSTPPLPQERRRGLPFRRK